MEESGFPGMRVLQFGFLSDAPCIAGAESYVVYTDSSGSGSSISAAQTVCAADYPFIVCKRGESVFIEERLCAEELLKSYGATLSFTEETEEGKSYYCYVKGLKYLKIIGGKRVNLHVFIGDGYTVIGSPIIYGGF